MIVSGLHNLPRYATGVSAIGLSVVFMVVWRSEPVIVLACSYFLVVCATDTVSSRIPNALNAALALAGFLIHYLQTGGSGLLSAFAGLLAGLALLLLPFLLGGVGAGDVKALAALGALLGPAGVLQVFLYAGLAGGVMAILHYLLAGRLREHLLAWKSAVVAAALTRDPRQLLPSSTREKLRFPYAAAFAFGFFAFVTWGDLL